MAQLSRYALAAVVIGVLLWLVITPNSENVHLKQNDPLETNTAVFGRGIYELDSGTTTLGEKADPNYTITFPQDHFEHTNFDIEWWYLTANLEDTQGHQYGLQWTLFRFRNPWMTNTKDTTTDSSDANWHNNQVYMAHASVHSMQNHWFAERFARGGIGNAGSKNDKFELFIDDWQWRNINNKKEMFPSELSFSIPLIKTSAKNSEATEVLKVDLTLAQSGPFVLHGDNGYSIKSGNKQHASHYYSAPFINVNGVLSISGTNKTTAIQVDGNAWFDQEWTSQLLDTSTLGWDWMSLHFDDGTKLMAFRMRLNDQEDYMTGSFITADGQLTTLLPEDLYLKPLSKSLVNAKSLPLYWQVNIPKFDIDITVETRKQEQWNPSIVSYYEGMVSVTGSHTGKGFLELTGY